MRNGCDSVCHVLTDDPQTVVQLWTSDSKFVVESTVHELLKTNVCLKLLAKTNYICCVDRE